MVLKIHHSKNDFLEKIYTDLMKSLNEFYEINCVHHLPIIIIVDDRETINTLKGKKTENWVVGWTNGSQVYILNKDSFEKESSHKYNPDEYSALIKHELSHCFYNILSGYHHFPIWLGEGVASYTSGQNNLKTQEEFDKFFVKEYGFSLNYDEINAQKFLV